MGSGGKVDNSNRSITPPSPQANYCYDDHQNFGLFEELVGQNIQKEYHEDYDVGHQFQEQIDHQGYFYDDHQGYGIMFLIGMNI